MFEMTAERRARLKELFAAVLEQPVEARSRFLSEVCGDDETLRNEILRLLAEHEQADRFLEEPVLLAMQRPVKSITSHHLAPGDIIAARYRISNFIAAGGMGEVYQARSEE